MLIFTAHRQCVRAGHDDEIRVLSRRDGRLDFRHHLLQGNDRFAGHVAATFRKNLILDEEPCHAGCLVFAHGAHHVNFENVLLRVYSFNARAIESYKRVGFREMGRRRRALKRERQFFDVIYMDITPEDLSGDA